MRREYVPRRRVTLMEGVLLTSASVVAIGLGVHGYSNLIDNTVAASDIKPAPPSGNATFDKSGRLHLNAVCPPNTRGEALSYYFDYPKEPTDIIVHESTGSTAHDVARGRINYGGNDTLSGPDNQLDTHYPLEVHLQASRLSISFGNDSLYARILCGK